MNNKLRYIGTLKKITTLTFSNFKTYIRCFSGNSLPACKSNACILRNVERYAACGGAWCAMRARVAYLNVIVAAFLLVYSTTESKAV